ncbi:hypothetical protein H5410_033736 [Solanum commersonii]|uniref:Uncharacterized protein n=1 Tax=Solanum commersonii TaxID=4109 RepID=A0A9J5YTZ0_SOLCO|nr:hypothetical protein H5410_033736 [Solanum commersonii]
MAFTEGSRPALAFTEGGYPVSHGSGPHSHGSHSPDVAGIFSARAHSFNSGSKCNLTVYQFDPASWLDS